MDHEDYEQLGQSPKLSEKDIILEPLQKKRNSRAWWASFVICVMTGYVIIAYCFFENTIVEYHVDNDICTKNVKLPCFRGEEKKTYYNLFINLGLTLIGIVLGTFLGLLPEEYCNWSLQYDSKAKIYVMFAVLILVTAGISIVFAFSPTFEPKHMLLVLGGIGVGPLIIVLLGPKSQSDIAVCSIIEEKETTVGATLAWTYHLVYLKKAMAKFREMFSNSSMPLQHQSTQVHLSSNKLILLISHDCYAVDNLEELDNNVTKVDDILVDTYNFSLYRLTIDESSFKYFVVQFVKEPLETIATMTWKSKAIKDNHEREYQVKMFYKQLCDILDKDNECREKCVLVPFKVKTLGSLNNGGLAKLIIHKTGGDKEQHGFMIPPNQQMPDHKGRKHQTFSCWVNGKENCPKEDQDGTEPDVPLGLCSVPAIDCQKPLTIH